MPPLSGLLSSENSEGGGFGGQGGKCKGGWEKDEGLGRTGTRMGGRRSTMRKEEEEEVKERNMTMSENKRGKM